MSECVCPAAGFCELAKRGMNSRTHYLCKTRADYRRLFWQESPKSAPKGACRHRGEDLRTEECEIGCRRGTRIKVIRCNCPLIASGEASVVPYAEDQEIPTCSGCSHYEM